MERVSVKVSSNQILKITNVLRALGLNTSLKGTKLLNKAIQYIISTNSDFFTIEDVYNYIHNYYDISYYQVKSAIYYAITNRNNEKAKKNFERIFNYEYDVYSFVPKLLIEEISNILVN